MGRRAVPIATFWRVVGILLDWLDLDGRRNYGGYMKQKALPVVRIGNSRGVRLPAELLRRYRIGDAVRIETLPDAILLRPDRQRARKLTWEETYRQMAAAKEDWAVWETVTADGLHED